MGCEACDRAQDSYGVAYYRWKHANVAMIGCAEHLREVFGALNSAQGDAPASPRLGEGDRETEA